MDIGKHNNSVEVIGIVMRKGVKWKGAVNLVEIVNIEEKREQQQPPIEMMFDKRK